jgi:hypothetical protein
MSITLQELNKKANRSKDSRSSQQKRQDKIDKLQSNPTLWKMLEELINEDISGLNKSFLKFRTIYQSGKRFSGREWVQLMSNLLDEIY